MENLSVSTQQKFDLFKKKAFESQYVTKNVALGEIEIEDDSTIIYNGSRLALSENAFKGLVRTVGLDKKVLATFDDNFGKEKTKKVLDLVKRSVAASGKNITIFGDPFTKEIGQIQDADKRKDVGLSTGSYFQLVEQLLNSGPDFVIKDFIASPDRVSLTLLDPKAGFSLKGLKDEDFKSGVILTNDFGKMTSFKTAVERMICTNRAVALSTMTSYNLAGNFTQEQWSKFYQHIKSLKGDNWLCREFEEKALIANATPSSLSEMKYAAKAMKKCSSDFGKKDMDLWIPLDATLDRYRGIGQKVDEYTEQQEAMAKTGTSIWKLFNSMTDFASHNYSFKATDTDKLNLQIAAGNLLMKDVYDINATVVSPF